MVARAEENMNDHTAHAFVGLKPKKKARVTGLVEEQDLPLGLNRKVVQEKSVQELANMIEQQQEKEKYIAAKNYQKIVRKWLCYKRYNPIIKEKVRLKKAHEASEKARIQRERKEAQAARVATPTNVVEEDSPQTQKRKRKRKLSQDNFNDVVNTKNRKKLKLPSKQGLSKKDIKFEEKFSTVSPRS